MTASKITGGSVVCRGEKLPAASCARFPNQKKGLFLPLEKLRDLVACFIHSSAQMCLCPTPSRRWSLITERFVNTAVRCLALDGISTRSAVVCVPLRPCADWRQHIHCAVPSLLLKPGSTPYPCLASEASAPVCPTWLTK